MKKKEIIRKLVLNKETISRLDAQDLDAVKGGASFTCNFPYTNCICEN